MSTKFPGLQVASKTDVQLDAIKTFGDFNTQPRMVRLLYINFLMGVLKTDYNTIDKEPETKTLQKNQPVQTYPKAERAFSDFLRVHNKKTWDTFAISAFTVNAGRILTQYIEQGYDITPLVRYKDMDMNLLASTTVEVTTGKSAQEIIDQITLADDPAKEAANVANQVFASGYSFIYIGEVLLSVTLATIGYSAYKYGLDYTAKAIYDVSFAILIVSVVSILAALLIELWSIYRSNGSSISATVEYLVEHWITFVITTTESVTKGLATGVKDALLPDVKNAGKNIVNFPKKHPIITPFLGPLGIVIGGIIDGI